MPESETTPWLLRTVCTDFLQTDICKARHVGCLAKRSSLPEDFYGKVAKIRQLLATRADHLKEWQQCLAREILLARGLGQPWATPLADELRDWPVFDGCETRLAGFANLPLAVACFPLVEGDGARPAFLWLFDDAGKSLRSDHSNRFKVSGEALHPGSKIFLVVSGIFHSSIHGNSWHLAAELAGRVLADPADQAETFARLAFDWIVTGAVQGDRVLPVDKIAQKSALRCGRQKLFPAANREEVSFARGVGVDEAWFTADADSAWAFIRGKGTNDGGCVDWPQPVAVMHSFVSGAWQPVVTCALLSRPQKIVLWHTDNEIVSRRPALELEKLFREKLFPGLGADFVSIRRISSENFAQAEQTLEPVLREDSAKGDNVIFNVTQGNRLMSFACFALAPRFPNLSLIYRDLDAPAGFLTLVKFESTLPTTQSVPPPPPGTLRNDIDWDKLFHSPPPKPGQGWMEIWDNIRMKS